jgi:hypothetical protein
MTPLSASTVHAAADLLACGWRPIEPLGRVEPPLGVQPTAAQWTSDPVWQALALMQLQAAGQVRT